MSICTVDECQKEHQAKGLCVMHYRRHQRANQGPDTVPQYALDAVFMFDNGAGWGEILTRTGRKAATLARELRRAGRQDLSQRILDGIKL